MTEPTRTSSESAPTTEASVVAPANVRSPPSSLPDPPESASSLLVVDDNPDNREPLARRLQRIGFQVDTACDGTEALRALADRPFDLVLLDIMMPGISGLEVLERIRATRSPVELPVVMQTALTQSDEIVRALELGANDYVTKPLDYKVVLARVRTHLRLKHAVHRVLELERHLSDQNAALLAAAERTRWELDSAARVQAAFLPKSPPQVPGVSFAWAFEPCHQLAGDSLNVVDLGDGHVGFYVLDVSGHGVAASLPAVAATRLLSTVGGHESLLIDADHDGHPRPADPARVAERLNERMPWNPQTNHYLTLFYATFDSSTGTLKYTSAGHPAGVRVRANGSTDLLEGADLPIGIDSGTYAQHEAQLHPGDRLYLYTDGVTEAANPQGELFGKARLVEALSRIGPAAELQESIQMLLRELSTWRGRAPSADDVSALAMAFAG